MPGGSRAFNGLEPTVHLYPIAPHGIEIAFDIQSYGSIYRELRQRHITPVGFEFLKSREEIDKTLPTDWRPYLPWDDGKIWPCDDQIQTWNQIGFAASREREAPLWDVARRISHQLRVCSWRLYQLSEAYHAQLHARVVGNVFDPGGKFEDGFTWLGYLATQVFLVH